MKILKRKAVMMAAVGLLALGVLTGCGSENKVADSNHKMYKVGVVQLVEHQALDNTNKGFIDGLASKGYVVGKNLEVDQQNAQGDQSNLSTITQRFINNKVDLIGAIATPSAQTAANQTKNIPIVGMAITDYEAAKLVNSNNAPGRNVTGASDALSPDKPLDLMLEINPNVKKVGVVYNASEVNSKVQVDAFKKAAQARHIEVQEVTVSSVNDLQQAAKSLVQQGVNAVYVPTDNVVASAYPNLIKIMSEAKIPVYPSESSAIKMGGLALYSIDYYKLGYQAGEMAGDILSGKAKPETMAVQTSKEYKLYINKEEAKKLGITIPEELLKKAEQ